MRIIKKIPLVYIYAFQNYAEISSEFSFQNFNKLSNLNKLNLFEMRLDLGYGVVIKNGLTFNLITQ
jgi:hypothetical protein